MKRNFLIFALGIIFIVTAGITLMPSYDNNTACDSMKVTITPNPATVCIGGCSNLTVNVSNATPPFVYSWSPNISTGSTANVCPTVTTTYTVYVTDSLGCMKSSSVTITIYPLPPIGCMVSSSICYGECGTLVACPLGITYSWSPGGETTSSIKVCPLATSCYTVAVTDKNGCSGSAHSCITVSPLPVPVLTSATVCLGACATISASGGTSYSWSPGGVGTTLTDCTLPVGTYIYTCTVTDANACSKTASTTITVNPLPVTCIRPNTSICIGACMTLTACGGINYTWSPGGYIGSSINVCPPVTTCYTVAVTNANGCTILDQTCITVNYLPFINASADTKICKGSCKTLTASGALTYLWSPGGSNPLTVCPTVTTIYTVTGTDANGCTGTSQTKVTIDPTCAPAFGGGYQPD